MNKLSELLNSEFLRRRARRPTYSLRAFAKQLDIDPTALTRVLKGERTVTRPVFERLAKKLGLSRDEMATLNDSIRETPGRPSQSTEHARAGRSGANRYYPVSQEVADTISKWYYFVILEVAYLRDFNSSPEWIAQKIGISVDEVQKAIASLEEFGLVKRLADGSWVDHHPHMTTIPDQISTQAMRQQQQAFLDKASKALDEVPIEKRDQSTMTFAGDSRKIAAAKRRIRKFRRDLNAFMQTSDTFDEVFQLTVSFIPTTMQAADKGYRS